MMGEGKVRDGSPSMINNPWVDKLFQAAKQNDVVWNPHFDVKAQCTLMIKLITILIPIIWLLI